jgi:hypothetical protein
MCKILFNPPSPEPARGLRYGVPPADRIKGEPRAVLSSGSQGKIETEFSFFPFDAIETTSMLLSR